MGRLEVTEKEKTGVRVVIVQGMADLPGWANKMMATQLGACRLYDPEWHDQKGLAEKLDGLERAIGEAKCNDGPVVVVGISAGAGLVLEYMLRNPSEIKHLFSVGGVLDPDLKKQRLEHLTRFSVGFREMVESLAKRSKEEKAVAGRRITAYSAGDEDKVVPKEALEPKWAGKIVRVGVRGHVPMIGAVLMTDVKRKLEELQGRSFE